MHRSDRKEHGCLNERSPQKHKTVTNKKSAVAAHSWMEGHEIEKESRLLWHISNLMGLTV